MGKSTLFNALLKKQQAYVANFPFATIEPNVGVVPVPDERLERLAQTIVMSNPSTSLRVSRPPVVPAVVQFVDIAGLIKGASQGEGLGNKFLSHIREVDAIVHVVRAFTDTNIIKQGVETPRSDFETVKTELELADLEMQERKEKRKEGAEVSLPLLASKPYLVAVNVDEIELAKSTELETKFADELGVEGGKIVIISAKTEAELAALSPDEQREYLAELGVAKSGLERLITKAFKTLGLMTFLTAGEKEVRAWTIHRGTSAPEAAGVIHTDFTKHFISARVCDYSDFVQYGGWKASAEQGKVRTEGRDYVMQEGDVVEFLTSA